MDARGIAPHPAMAAAIDCGMNKPSHFAKVYFFVVNINKHISNTKNKEKEILLWRKKDLDLRLAFVLSFLS